MRIYIYICIFVKISYIYWGRVLNIKDKTFIDIDNVGIGIKLGLKIALKRKNRVTMQC